MNNTASPNDSLHLAPAHLSLVQVILADHLPQARVLAFGSRAVGTPRKYSDLDLAIIQPEPLTLRAISRLKNAFEDSDLPICVDVVDWNQADSEFKAMVAAQGMVELSH
jgi:predicted nucleotidyltransferase